MERHPSLLRSGDSVAGKDWNPTTTGANPKENGFSIMTFAFGP